jgi:putative endonuclease
MEARPASNLMYYVYILKCKDGSLYTGITTDVERRLAEHKNGKGAKYTRARKVGKIVYVERKRNCSTASRREVEIKSRTRQKKLSFVQERIEA